MEKPDRVLVKFRVNQSRAEEMRRAGLYEIKRTVAQDQALRQRQETEAVAVGRDPFRAHRADATGTIRPDSGTPMFTWDPKGRVDVCLALTLKDLRDNLGMVLTQVNALQKPQDHMAFLVMKFEKTGTPTQLTPEQQMIVDRITNRVYEHLHGYRNPDKSWTFNAAHAQDSVPEIRDVRINPEGAVRCELR